MSAVRLVLCLPRPRGPLSPWVSGSILVHAVITTALIFLPALKRSSEISSDWVVVDLVGPLAPSAPAPAPSRPEPPPRETVPAPAPPPEPEGARMEPEARQPERPPEQPQPRASSQPEATDSPVAAGASVSAGSGADIATLDLADMQNSVYARSVVAALGAWWVRPILDDQRDTLEVTVAFEIERDGRVRNPRIVSSSGVPALDRSALRAVVDASPLPPLPRSFRDPVVPARMVFSLKPGVS